MANKFSPHIKSATAYLTVGLVSLMNIVGGIAMEIYSTPINITTMSTIKAVVDNPDIVGPIMIVVGLLALPNVLWRTPWLYSFVTILIQFLLLTAYASGSINAMRLGEFADGTARDIGFLILDQRYSVVLAILHGVALYKIHSRRVLWEALQNGDPVSALLNGKHE